MELRGARPCAGFARVVRALSVSGRGRQGRYQMVCSVVVRALPAALVPPSW